ncbi:MAG TPA: hybrid sensor histidine kinase/response regulator [Kofleriaceae bacterium]|nr:hybrid sensor histidine kinase/response regulator [Kofleriaceae bacterium]
MLDAHETLRLLAQLADLPRRPAHAIALAHHLGGEALFVFVPHPDVATKLIPAPGFAASMPSGRGWRELLARCGTPGIHTGAVAFPRADELRDAVAYAFDGITFAVVGGRADDSIREQLATTAPLVSGMLRADSSIVATRGELAVARQSAERAAALSRALDLARGEAERATRIKDEFLAMLGHELRNPLAPILTALQLLRLEGVATRVQDVLERQVHHVMRLVDDLLDIAKITRGRVELRRQRIELADVVDQAIEMTRSLLDSRHNELILEVPAHGLCVDADPARLAQVVANLLTNASRYSDVAKPIRITGTRNADHVELAVHDQGIGIDPLYIDQMFEQFTQVPQGIERSGGGLGLGLAIVRSLVTLHGGKVDVTSAGPGRGSTFLVRLPWCDQPAIETEPDELPVAGGGSPLCVLIVDDNRDAAELLAEILLYYGYRVSVEHDGFAALDHLDRFTPDVAMLDIGLPGMDGFELARRLRARLPRIRLMAVTGYGQEEDRVRSRQAGFDVHLVKPVSINVVTQELDRLLRN